jgi:glycosyltransferase involved in cell wall biosynthesis
MKVAFLGAEGVPYPAAFAKITEEIGARLADRGNEVLVYGRRRYVAHNDAYRGMQRRAVTSFNTKHFDTLSFSSLSMLHLLGSGWADVAHIHGIGPGPLAAGPRLRGIKTVVHVHALDWNREKWGKVAKLCLRAGERASVSLPDATVTVSRGLKQYLEQKYEKPVFYVPQGLDEPIYAEAQEILAIGLRPRDYLLFMGRLVPEKGVHHLLDAYKSLANQWTDKARPLPPLVIAGSPAHSAEYAESLRRTAPSNVRFLGHVDGRLKLELFSNAAVYLQPSLLEGLSLTLLEALSYGNAVLVSDIPENLEVMSDLESSDAMTFRTGDVGDLSLKLEELLRDEEHTRQIGERAGAKVRAMYSWDHATDEMEHVYESILAPGRALKAERSVLHG